MDERQPSLVLKFLYHSDDMCSHSPKTKRSQEFSLSLSVCICLQYMGNYYRTKIKPKACEEFQ